MADLPPNANTYVIAFDTSYKKDIGRSSRPRRSLSVGERFDLVLMDEYLAKPVKLKARAETLVRLTSSPSSVTS